jgi:hypothetical protein
LFLVENLEEIVSGLKDVDLKDLGFSENDLNLILKDSVEKDVLPPSDFKDYDENIETCKCCPKCGYEWN